LIKPSIDTRAWASFRLRWITWTKERQTEMTEALSKGAWIAATIAQTKYLSGRVLNVKTGRLRASVRVVPSKGADIAGNRYTVQVGTNVFYGGAWEHGYSVPAKEIRPKTKKALKIPVGGSKRSGGQSFVLRRKVNRKSYSVKARPWLQPAMDEAKPMMKDLLSKVGVRFK
jgi:hypothetical protein